MPVCGPVWNAVDTSGSYRRCFNSTTTQYFTRVEIRLKANSRYEKVGDGVTRFFEVLGDLSLARVAVSENGSVRWLFWEQAVVELPDDTRTQNRGETHTPSSTRDARTACMLKRMTTGRKRTLALGATLPRSSGHWCRGRDSNPDGLAAGGF